MKEHPILMNQEMVGAVLDGRKNQTRRVMKPQPEGKLADLSEWAAGLASACGDHNADKKRLIEHSHKLEGSLFPFKNKFGDMVGYRCPYGKIGDLLWVRETHYVHGWWVKNGISKTGKQKYRFKALEGIKVYFNGHLLDLPDNIKICTKKDQIGYFKRPSIFMPKKYARIWLKIKDIRVERVQDISEWDAMSEGVSTVDKQNTPYRNFKQSFISLWDRINANRKDKQGQVLPYSWNDNPYVWCVEFERIEKIRKFQS